MIRYIACMLSIDKACYCRCHTHHNLCVFVLCCLCVMLLVHNHELSKNGWTDQNAVWDTDLCQPQEPCYTRMHVILGKGHFRRIVFCLADDVGIFSLTVPPTGCAAVRWLFTRLLWPLVKLLSTLCLKKTTLMLHTITLTHINRFR